jgi:hypothetical protein
LETQYIADTDHGNIIRGWDGFMDRFVVVHRESSISCSCMLSVGQRKRAMLAKVRHLTRNVCFRGHQ